MSGVNFGDLLRNRRLAANMTLREFARLTSYDPSNISKVERNVATPPPTITLKVWAKHLKLQPGSADYQEFLDIAQIARNRIPEDAPAEFRNKLLPAMLRTARSKDLTKEEFDRLVELLNK